MRIALLSYRSKPHCGGQGIYLRHLSRELTALGHTVEVFSGQPYPELDDGVTLTEVPSLDLYREPDPFRVPRLREFRDRVDVEEFLTMCAAGFPGSPSWYRSMRIQCISRPRRTWSFPTVGMLFSAWQATTQALQPVHDERFTESPHAWCSYVQAG